MYNSAFCIECEFAGDTVADLMAHKVAVTMEEGLHIVANGLEQGGGKNHKDIRTDLNVKVMEGTVGRWSGGSAGARCRCWCCRCSLVAACQESCYCGCCRAMSDLHRQGRPHPRE